MQQHPLLSDSVALRWCTCALRCTMVLALVFAANTRAQDWVYTARPGDTLSELAVQYLGVGYGARDLQVYNALEDANRLPTGTRLRVPVTWLKLQPTPATLIRFTGDVERFRDDGETTEPLAPGIKLYAGDTLRSGSNGAATIEFADRSRMRLQSDSSVTLDALSVMGTTGMVDTSMRLHGGRGENTVEPLDNPNSRYRVITPPTVAAVRGTEFRIGYEIASERMTGEVADGTIGVSAQGVSREIPAGFGVVTRLGEPPGEPAALLSAPDVSQLPAAVPRNQIAFVWPVVTGAVAYRNELFGGEQFERLVQSVTVDEPEVALAPIPLDRYVLQLRAIDASGLAGADARHEFEVERPLAPPALIAPPDLSAWRDSTLRLVWSAPTGARQFQLQLARDRGFTDLVIERSSIKDLEFELPAGLPPGRYYWRVARAADDDADERFTQPFEFTVYELPVAPQPHVKETTSGTLRFSWTTVTQATRYRLQLARDARFRELVLDIDTPGTELRVAALPWGRYFYRVQSIGDSGRLGAPSAARVLQVPRWIPAPQVLLLVTPLLILLLLHLRFRRSS
jgi:hypothetical protein